MRAGGAPFEPRSRADSLRSPDALAGRAARAALLVLLGAYLLARILILAKGHVFTSYDTITYALRGDPAIDRGSLVSLTGNSPRLLGVPAFYALFPSDGLRAAGQWVVGTVAWSGLAWVVWGLPRTIAARLAGAGLVLVLGLHRAVGSWDLAILSESLSISLGVLVVAGLLRWAATGSSPALVVATAAGFWWTFTRPDIRVMTVLVVAGLALVAWRMPARRRVALVAAGVLVVAVGWCSAIVPNTNDVNKRYTPFGAEHAAEEWILFRLRVQVLPDPAIKAVFTEKLGMPSCPPAEAIATRPEWDILEFAEAYRACPELKAWGDANRDTVFNRFAVVAPAEYARMTVGLINESVLGDAYADVPDVIPRPLQKVAFPGIRFALLSVLVSFAVAVAAVVLTRARRQPDLPHGRLLVDTAGAVALVSVVSMMAGVLYGTGEFWRFGIQEAIGLRLAVILLLAASLDAYLWHRHLQTGRAAGHARAERAQLD